MFYKRDINRHEAIISELKDFIDKLREERSPKNKYAIRLASGESVIIESISFSYTDNAVIFYNDTWGNPVAYFPLPIISVEKICIK